jgi:hypothetical protein
MTPLYKLISIDHDIFSLITIYNEKYRPNCVANKYSIIFNTDTGVVKCIQYFDKKIYILCIEKEREREKKKEKIFLFICFVKILELGIRILL